MRREQFIYDKERQIVRGRFFELKKQNKKHAPMHKICSFDEFHFRNDGRRRSKREQTNLLLRLYQEKLEELRNREQQLLEEKEKKTKALSIMKVMQQWIDDEVTPYNKTITTREYLRTCTLYLENVGDHSILEFKKHHSTRFQSGLKKHGLTDAGIRKHQTHLQIFLNWAYSEEHLEKPIRLNKVRVLQNGPVIYTKSEVEILQFSIEKASNKALTTYQKRFTNNHLSAFMAARHAILRCGEILSLLLRNIFLEEGKIRITGVPEVGWLPKTRQERFIPLNPELRSFLQSDLLRRNKEEQWFLDNGLGDRAYSTNSQLTQVFRRYVIRNDLELKDRKPLHALRATGITEMLSAGGKLDFVMRIAGHSNPQTTLNHYVRAENFDLRDTVNLLSSPQKNVFVGLR